MNNRNEGINTFQDIGGKSIPTKWIDTLKVGDYNITFGSGCWSINTRNSQIISFTSEDDLNKWERDLVHWRNRLKTKNISNSGVKTRKTKRKSRRPKVVVRKDFIITDAFKRMKSDSEYWREQP